MEKKRFVFIFFMAILSFQAVFAQQAQVLTGSWFSNGTVKVDGVTNNYLGELKLVQNGRAVIGQFNYYFRDSLFTNKIEGFFDLDSRYLVIKSFPIMLHQSTSTKNGVDCSMRGEFLLRVSRVGSFLAGSFKADDAYKYTCPDILFSFEKSTDTISPIAQAKAATVASKIPVDTIAKDPIAIATQKMFENRPKEYFKELFISSGKINIELYDNGAIDYDSVSIFLNNKLILKKTMLSYVPIKLTLPLDSLLPFNEISMFANNEGQIPPNTATLVLIDGDDRYELEMNSSLNRTATLKLSRKRR
ncbi:hypothetical protein [Parasediminibacterium sp. JCM 36343]|uniref:hypothetical protein n=1 Tax=Parasediminibacterium sp. JCM 36343 TaxID=3374279 RepID=UPI00397ADC27